MNNNNPKTVSFEEVQEFIDNDLKIGNLYKIVSRKYDNYTDIPYLLNLNKNEWFSIPELTSKNDIIVFYLDEIPRRLPSSASLSATAPSWVVAPMRTKTRWPTPRQLDIWYSMFIKVLYQDKICFIHAGWLEKI